MEMEKLSQLVDEAMKDLNDEESIEHNPKEIEEAMKNITESSGDPESTKHCEQEDPVDEMER